MYCKSFFWKETFVKWRNFLVWTLLLVLSIPSSHLNLNCCNSLFGTLIIPDEFPVPSSGYRGSLSSGNNACGLSIPLDRFMRNPLKVIRTRFPFFPHHFPSALRSYQNGITFSIFSQLNLSVSSRRPLSASSQGVVLAESKCKGGSINDLLPVALCSDLHTQPGHITGYSINQFLMRLEFFGCDLWGILINQVWGRCGLLFRESF